MSELTKDVTRRILETEKWYEEQIDELEMDNRKLRRILSHISSRIVIKAKKDAGYPDYITTCSVVDKGVDGE